MKLMQNEYPMIAKIEVQLTQEKEMDQLPNRPSKFININSFQVRLSVDMTFTFYSGFWSSAFLCGAAFATIQKRFASGFKSPR